MAICLKESSIIREFYTMDKVIAMVSHRRQVTEIKGTVSEELDMQLGAPQGWILGPILFLIYVNDINNCSKAC